ncbi:transcriptional regulator [Gordonibacter sp. 28C]|uniref:type II toxin-antitoxin system Y4mF family antitoxin n=1 Tax=Gordonibacter sp. 28C TaxID=2078569 RepID=UPI000DF84D5B|nr:type II toxin-antitoxin system Y4mF family antitoxin [Gordonibacter sp. 28C]RDB63832.1 transcriptional regulator [Gordonibacter sp. 28C]
MTAFATAEELGAIVRTERRRQGYTQTKLARYSGVGINFVSNLENGKETSELGKTLRVVQTLGLDLSACARDNR